MSTLHARRARGAVTHRRSIAARGTGAHSGVMSIIPRWMRSWVTTTLLLLRHPPLLLLLLASCSPKIIIRITTPRPRPMTVQNLPLPFTLCITSLIPKTLQPLRRTLRRTWCAARRRQVTVVGTTSVSPAGAGIRVIMRPWLLLLRMMRIGVRVIIIHRPRRRPLPSATHPQHLPRLTLRPRRRIPRPRNQRLATRHPLHEVKVVRPRRRIRTAPQTARHYTLRAQRRGIHPSAADGGLRAGI